MITSVWIEIVKRMRERWPNGPTWLDVQVDKMPKSATVTAITNYITANCNHFLIPNEPLKVSSAWGGGLDWTYNRVSPTTLSDVGGVIERHPSEKYTSDSQYADIADAILTALDVLHVVPYDHYGGLLTGVCHQEPSLDFTSPDAWRTTGTSTDAYMEYWQRRQPVAIAEADTRKNQLFSPLGSVLFCSSSDSAKFMAIKFSDDTKLLSDIGMGGKYIRITGVVPRHNTQACNLIAWYNNYYRGVGTDPGFYQHRITQWESTGETEIKRKNLGLYTPDFDVVLSDLNPSMPSPQYVIGPNDTFASNDCSYSCDVSLVCDFECEGGFAMGRL